MPSSRPRPSLRRQIYLSLVSKVEGQIRDVFAKRAETEGLTQSAVAEKLGIHRAVVNRRLNGRTNMTIETIADMAWALGACVDVDIYDPAERPDKNHALAQEFRVLGLPPETPMQSGVPNAAATFTAVAA